jgi:hypothetical protein
VWVLIAHWLMLTISQWHKEDQVLGRERVSLNVKLSDSETRKIREEIEVVEVTGDRYPPFLAAYSFADTPAL